jgi:hypothetical protein
MNRSTFPLCLVVLGMAACSAPSSNDRGVDVATNAETSVPSYTAEVRFDLAGDGVVGKPVRRVRAKIDLFPNVSSSSVTASHVTTSDKSGFEHHECDTTILFPGATAAIDVLDDAGTTLATYTKPLTMPAGFSSPTDPGTTCTPHQYPDLSQDSSIVITPDAIAFSDGTKIDGISFSFDVHLAAVRQGESWKLTSVTLDPFQYANLNHSASYQLPGSGRLAWTPVYAAGKRSPHHVVASVDLASCTLTDTYGDVGDPQPAKYHFHFAYERSLDAGARVFVKYNERRDSQTQPGWSDDKVVELTRSASTWTGEVTLDGTARPVKGYPNAAERDAVSQANSISSLLYVFHIRHADGTEEWENGSTAQFGNYRTAGDQSGRYGYYGFLLPASCDGLGRTAALEAQVDASH